MRWLPLNLGSGLLAMSLGLCSPKGTSASAEVHSCVQGRHGLTWQVVKRHPTYSTIKATEPVNAAIYRGTIRRLPNSALWLIALSTWGEAVYKLGNWHPYAIVYWPGKRPEWLILLNSPTLLPGAEVRVWCRR